MRRAQFTMHTTLNECLEALFADKDMLKNPVIDILYRGETGKYSYCPYKQGRSEQIEVDGETEILYAVVERTKLANRWEIRPHSADAATELQINSLPAHLVVR